MQDRCPNLDCMLHLALRHVIRTMVHVNHGRLLDSPNPQLKKLTRLVYVCFKTSEKKTPILIQTRFLKKYFQIYKQPVGSLL